MSTDVQAPQPTPEEQALQQTQVELLQQQVSMLEEQQNLQEALAPVLFESAGLQPIVENGEIVGFEQTAEAAELAGLEDEFTRESIERGLQAIRGELPVDAGIVEGLNQAETRLRATLRDRLGPGFETSTPGIQALSEFKRNKQIALDAARRGDTTAAQQFFLGQGGGSQADEFGDIGAAFQLGVPNPGGFGQAAAGFQGPISNLQNQRQMQFEAALQSSQNNLSALKGIGQFGSLFLPTSIFGAETVGASVFGS